VSLNLAHPVGVN